MHKTSTKKIKIGQLHSSDATAILEILLFDNSMGIHMPSHFSLVCYLKISRPVRCQLGGWR